ncbi:MAG: hypothetical protein G01um101456_654 [Parcubacteria group bacterium Gr01-1014_56]|nr:MAG: hypothetical protein G01um101456_654 [Parcubacteria group bacterium Gr01-1014_56]
MYMLYASLLAAHVSAAIITGAVILYTLYAVAKGLQTQYFFLALFLGSIAAIMVSTGSLLAYVSPTVTMLSLSLHMTAYLSVCLGVEVLLYVASRYRSA